MIPLGAAKTSAAPSRRTDAFHATVRSSSRSLLGGILYTLTAASLLMGAMSCAKRDRSSEPPASSELPERIRITQISEVDSEPGTTSSYGDRFSPGPHRLPDISNHSSGKPLQRFPVTLTPGEAKVVGGLSTEVIREAFRRHEGEIRYCYERRLQFDPKMQGEVEMRVVIGSTGRVDDVAAARDTIGDTGLVAECLVQRIRRWRFPEPDGGGQVLVTYPWSFRPGGGTD